MQEIIDNSDIHLFSLSSSSLCKDVKGDKDKGAGYCLSYLDCAKMKGQ